MGDGGGGERSDGLVECCGGTGEESEVVGCGECFPERGRNISARDDHTLSRKELTLFRLLYQDRPT